MTNREEKLKGQGWEKRFVASEPRLSEAVDLYESIGFDVLLEPLPDDEELKKGGCGTSGCTACFETDKERYRIIFTKAKKGKTSQSQS
jgi:hypothetical protein